MVDLFLPLDKEMVEDEEGNRVGRKFFMSNVEAFTKPLVVVPDVGGPSNRYLLLHNRPTWVKLFTDWLDKQHELRDVIKERRAEEKEAKEDNEDSEPSE